MTSQALDSVGRVMVNITDPNSYLPGGRTWAIAFVGIVGDLPLITADGRELLPAAVPYAPYVEGMGGTESVEDAVAFWPPDAASITVSELQRGESVAAASEVGPKERRASGTVDVMFDADGSGSITTDERVTVAVGANESTVQKALCSMGGLLDEVEVSVDDGSRRARNGG